MTLRIGITHSVASVRLMDVISVLDLVRNINDHISAMFWFCATWRSIRGRVGACLHVVSMTFHTPTLTCHSLRTTTYTATVGRHAIHKYAVLPTTHFLSWHWPIPNYQPRKRLYSNPIEEAYSEKHYGSHCTLIPRNLLRREFHFNLGFSVKIWAIANPVWEHTTLLLVFYRI